MPHDRKFSPALKLAPTGVADVDIVGAHTHSIDHRLEVLSSEACGCFNCLKIFEPSAIDRWVDQVNGVDVTALCPSCGMDAVLGSASGYPIEPWFLARMRTHWMGDD